MRITSWCRPGTPTSTNSVRTASSTVSSPRSRSGSSRPRRSRLRQNSGGNPMAVTVSTPTILRPHTGGQKSVEATGETVREVIDDIESRHSGIKARLVKDDKLHRFINVYVNDEDVRFAGGLEAKVSDGDTVTILPAVAGG